MTIALLFLTQTKLTQMVMALGMNAILILDGDGVNENDL